MTDSAADAQNSRPFRFSTGTLMLVTVIVALVLAIGVLYGKVRRLDAKLNRAETAVRSMQPIAANEVARQFEAVTTNSQIKTSVEDVRYSSKEDAYRVVFSWTVPGNKTGWSTDVTLVNDGFGFYYGQIRKMEYIRPMGVKELYMVVVSTPSPLTKR